MPDEKLNLPHKVFAAIERMVKETKVENVNLNFSAPVGEIAFDIPEKTTDIDLQIPSEIDEILFTIETTTYEIVENLITPEICDAEMEKLDAAIHDEQVDAIRDVPVYDEPIHMETDTHVTDFFQKFKLQTKLFYTTTVKDIGFSNLKAQVQGIAIQKFFQVTVKENIYFFKRLTVQHKPVVLSFLTEREQLGYWKRAVVKAQKEAKKLEMLGVYSGVPYDFIENIKINYSNKNLCYHLKAKTPRPGENIIKDLALFIDLDTNKTIVVKSK